MIYDHSACPYADMYIFRVCIKIHHLKEDWYSRSAVTGQSDYDQQ